MNNNKVVPIVSTVIGLAIIGLIGYFIFNQMKTTTSNNSNTTVTASASKYISDYTIDDTGYGTKLTVKVDKSTGKRTIISNALPNHKTGTFPNDNNPNSIKAQSLTWSYASTPKKTDKATEVKETGVAINGVKFDPGTAERATCESGETYRLEALQQFQSVGLDFNNAHVQPDGTYHYHGLADELVKTNTTSDDLVHIGFAADGHLIYASKSEAYKPSYALSNKERAGTNCTIKVGLAQVSVKVDNTTTKGAFTADYEYSAGSGKLDECNGTTINGEYAYVATKTFPYIPRCLNGEVTQTGPGAGGPPPTTTTPTSTTPTTPTPTTPTTTTPTTPNANCPTPQDGGTPPPQGSTPPPQNGDCPPPPQR